MRGGVTLARVVQVVGGHVRQLQLAGYAAQPGGGAHLHVEAMVHQLDEEVLRPEDVPVHGRRLEGQALLAEPEPGLYLATGAAGGGDDALGVPGEQLTVHPRLAEVAFQRGHRGQLEQVVHTLGGLGQQGHVGVRPGAGDVVVLLRRGSPPDRLLVPAVLRRDVRLDADDRLDAGRAGLRPEVIGAVDVAVVGHGDRRHARLLALGEQVLQPRGTVQHRVLGVYVQVHERAVPARCVRGCPHESTASFGHASQRPRRGVHETEPGEVTATQRLRNLAGEATAGARADPAHRAYLNPAAPQTRHTGRIG